MLHKLCPNKQSSRGAMIQLRLNADVVPEFNRIVKAAAYDLSKMENDINTTFD